MKTEYAAIWVLLGWLFCIYMTTRIYQLYTDGTFVSVPILIANLAGGFVALFPLLIEKEVLREQVSSFFLRIVYMIGILVLSILAMNLVLYLYYVVSKL